MAKRQPNPFPDELPEPIGKLLTEFQLALIAGSDPDPTTTLAMCPTDYREQFIPYLKAARILHRLYPKRVQEVGWFGPAQKCPTCQEPCDIFNPRLRSDLKELRFTARCKPCGKEEVITLSIPEMLRAFRERKS